MEKKDEYFLECCQECGGKCCKPGGLYITKSEYDNLPKKFQKYFFKHFFGYHTKLGEKCPFLNKNGCILDKNRFLECKLYPLEVIAINKLYLKKECPFSLLFNNAKYLKNGIKLLTIYKKEKLFSEKDVISILNNPYPNHL